MNQIVTKKLLLTATLVVLFGNNSIVAQTIIEGTVKSKEGIKIPSASVTIKGSITVAVADSNGNFKINTTSPLPIVLEISAAGYFKQPFKIATLQATPFVISLTEDSKLTEVLVTARRRQEVAQDIPIPITVLGGTKVEETGSFNVNRLKELVPSVQLYTSNPRNTTLNIRGLGSTFGLTNDGIEPGVGFYIDGVYNARPAVTSLDFVDIDRIEVLRGPQGTLFGKNTTAGAFNIFTKKPTFTPTAKAELSYGNYNFIQAKASVSGSVTKNIAGRISFSGTQRQGTIFHEKQQQYYNGLNNVGIKGQLLWLLTNKLEILLSADYSVQNPDGYSLVVAGITKTQRSAYRQYDSIIKDLGYGRPTINPFARKIETDASWKHNQIISGAHVNIDYKIGKSILTSTTAWRFWDWDPVNDRDFTGIPALSKSQASSRHNQYSQELRYAGSINNKISSALGFYYLYQNLYSPTSQIEEVGSAQWRFVQTSNTGAQAKYNTPGLLDNYGIKTDFDLKTISAAFFGQLDWEIAKGFHVLPGLRYNYDKKDLAYARTTYGGLQTTDPALLALKKAVYSDQAFASSTSNTNLSANITLSYRPADNINVYATYSNNYKSIGLNLGGLPTKATTDSADLSLAEVKPEYVQHYEFGIKTRPFKGAILNITAFITSIKDYQTTVQVPQIGLNRGYLANAEKVNVKGIEIDATYQFSKDFSANAALAYTDAKYVSFTNAPLALEETGKTINGQQQAFTDASGGVLPGVSKWNVTGGFDWSFTKGKFLNRAGKYFIATDGSVRTQYSSNPTPSAVLNIGGYGLLNARIGFKSDNFTIFAWGRNITGTNYFEQLQAAAGNSGVYVGVLGDPRTYGVTLRFSFL
ncbi:MAG: TonB-dependent receptor [Deinococcales bacterium]|nr:TonB-dependent receptor [Chitinophagaceae bacterium]